MKLPLYVELYCLGLIQRVIPQIKAILTLSLTVFNMYFHGTLEDYTAQLNKHVPSFKMSELRKNAAICSVLEQDGIVLYDK